MADDQSSKERWPAWNEPATKGDIIRAIVYQRGVTMKLGTALFALVTGDEQGAREAMNKYLEENQALTELIDDLGGD